MSDRWTTIAAIESGARRREATEQASRHAEQAAGDAGGFPALHQTGFGAVALDVLKGRDPSLEGAG